MSTIEFPDMKAQILDVFLPEMLVCADDAIIRIAINDEKARKICHRMVEFGTMEDIVIDVTGSMNRRILKGILTEVRFGEGTADIRICWSGIPSIKDLAFRGN